MTTVYLHDTRLHGMIDRTFAHSVIYRVGPSTSLATAFSLAQHAASSSGDELVIACHGYMSADYNGQCHMHLNGGWGLQFCRETLRVGNVAASAALAGYFSRIWLMACGPAGTAVGKGRPFCHELAAYTQATVIASDTEQTYTMWVNESNSCAMTLRFGAWEGNVYSFSPGGSMSPFQMSESPLP